MTDPSGRLNNSTPTLAGPDRSDPPAGSEHGAAPQRSPWLRLFLAAAAIAIIALAAEALLREKGAPTESTGLDPLNLAPVVITDLIQEESFDGTLGSIQDDPVRTHLGGTITWITAAGDTVGQGEALFAIDNQPAVLLYGDQPAFRDIAIGEDAVTVSTPLNGTITWVAEPGTVIEQGSILFRVDDRPVVALHGDLPAYRNLGLSRPDLGLAAAEAFLASTQASLEQLLAGPSEGDLESAQLSVDSAKNQLWSAQTQRDAVRGNPNASQVEIDLAEASVLQAQVSVEQALLQQRSLTQPPSAAELASAEGQVAQAQAQVEQAQLAADADGSGLSPSHPGEDVRQLEQALGALGYDPEGTVTVDDTFTAATEAMVESWQKDVGVQVDGVVDLGEVVFFPGPAQVLEILAPPGSHAGSDVLLVATGQPATGADVHQLEEALLALGHDAEGSLVADGIYTIATSQAVLAFQAALGLEQDGIVDLGEIIFLPGALRVTAPLAAQGSTIGAGSAVLAISLSEKVVRVDLPADDQGLLRVGDAVTVEMPDDTLTPATVVSVAQTATASANGQATFEVLVALDDPTVAAGLDEAPVDVIIATDSVQKVLAVPVSALVALLEGGYAVEVHAGGVTELVGIEVGFFGDNNMIEITSGALQPGDQVIVP